MCVCKQVWCVCLSHLHTLPAIYIYIYRHTHTHITDTLSLQYELFDSDDLWSEHVYLFHTHNAHTHHLFHAHTHTHIIDIYSRCSTSSSTQTISGRSTCTSYTGSQTRVAHRCTSGLVSTSKVSISTTMKHV